MAMKISLVDKDGNPAEVSYATKYSAGFDIKADLTSLGRGESATVALPINGGARKIPTGLFLNVEGEPDGNEVPALMIVPRSGKSLEGLRVSNSPGIIDADYEGEIMIIVDLDTPSVGYGRPIKHGDKIAQGVFIMVPRFDIEAQDVERGDGGFGSTDKKKIVTPAIKK
jgi:dUTP pyrophosphatase